MKTQQIDVAAIERVVVGHSGMSVNEVPIMELHLHIRDRKKIRALRQCRDDELEWIAGMLRTAVRRQLGR